MISPCFLPRTFRLPLAAFALFVGGGFFSAHAQSSVAFEIPRAWPAESMRPGDSLYGPGWSLDATVANDGIYNAWTVVSNGTAQRVVGDDRMAGVLLEMEAVRWLSEASRGREFAMGLRDAGQAQLDAVVQIARDPVNTARRLPGGAARFLGRVGETVRNTAQGTLDVDRTATPEQQARRLIGAERAKRLLAAELGVSPFTRNAELQRLLDDFALVRSMGRVTVDVGSFFLITGAISHVLTGINVTSFLTKEQIAAEPRDLLASNRLRAIESGVPPALVDAFQANPFYDPWTLTAIWNNLRALGGVNPTAFVEQAAGAMSEVDAFFFFRTSQMLARLPESGIGVREFVPMNRTVACVAADGSLVVPLWLDFAIWTREAQAASERLQALARERGARRAVVVTNGRFSPVAAERLRLMGIETVTGFTAPPAR